MWQLCGSFILLLLISYLQIVTNLSSFLKEKFVAPVFSISHTWQLFSHRNFMPSVGAYLCFAERHGLINPFKTGKISLNSLNLVAQLTFVSGEIILEIWSICHRNFAAIQNIILRWFDPIFEAWQIYM